MKHTVIFGGGTFEPVRNHLSLAAPAFGRTAKTLSEMIPGSKLFLTKMADSLSNLVTGGDISNQIDLVLEDLSVNGIILSVAFCDYKVSGGDFHGERFSSSLGPITLDLYPLEKIINKIRRKRPDIFLVGFKTTTGKSVEDQFLIGLKMMKGSKCNLVLANDVVTRQNIIITPEETYYGPFKNREEVLRELVDIYSSRLEATYEKSQFIPGDSFRMDETSLTFQEVVRYLINNGGYLENNGNGFTPGHFCQKLDETTFLSSQRKADHTKVFEEGLSRVRVNGEGFTVSGKRKASVGARSQWMLLQKNPEYDCIIHTHNPLKPGSLIPSTPQKPFQCGSLECGQNTVENLAEFNGIRAVYLEKHGANILFKSQDSPEKIIKFINENIQLGVKTT